MNNIEIEILRNSLKLQLDETEKMWNEKVPHAQIIGYLQGTIKGVLGFLDTKLK
jgi:hypothetical protein